MTPNRGVFDQHELFAKGFVQCGLAFRAIEILAIGFTFPQKIHHRPCRVHQRLHGPRPTGAQHIIGILTIGHDRKAQRLPSFQQRERQIHDTLRGTNARRIAIQSDDRLITDAPHQLQLGLCYRRAQGGHRGSKSRLRQGDHIHIAFCDNQALPLARGLPRRAMVIERAALIKKLSLR